jgi:hypothetical protein
MQVTNTLPKMNIEPPVGWGLEETHFHKKNVFFQPLSI